MGKQVKKTKKTIAFYRKHFGFFSPFNVLIDATFCNHALENKVNIREQLPKLLCSELNLVTTQCVIKETEQISKVSKSILGAWLIVKSFAIHRCGHERNPVSAVECLKSMIADKNPSRYFVASMDKDVQKYIFYKVPGCPSIYLYGHTPILSQASPLSKNLANPTLITDHEKKNIEQLKIKYDIEEEVVKEEKKKKKQRSKKRLLDKLKEKEATAEPPKKKKRKTKPALDINEEIERVFGSK